MKLDDLQEQLWQVGKQLVRYRVLLFALLLTLVYGTLALHAHSLSTAQPDRSAVASQNKLTQPHIDQATVNKIKQLQDNSVSVQALFNQARQNPFNE